MGSNNAGSNYKIGVWDPVYQVSLVQLGLNELASLKDKINTLRSDPNLIAKPLRKTLQGKYTVRFAEKKWRLVITISWDSHKIRLL